mgnify:CR=1 FL=1
MTLACVDDRISGTFEIFEFGFKIIRPRTDMMKSLALAFRDNISISISLGKWLNEFDLQRASLGDRDPHGNIRGCAIVSNSVEGFEFILIDEKGAYT